MAATAAPRLAVLLYVAGTTAVSISGTSLTNGTVQGGADGLGGAAGAAGVGGAGGAAGQGGAPGTGSPVGGIGQPGVAGFHNVSGQPGAGGQSGTAGSATFPLSNVSTTTTGVASSVDPSTLGQSVSFIATVTNTTGAGTPTGKVEFYDGTTDLGPGSALSGGGNSATSTFTISTLALGNHSIEAVYTAAGDLHGQQRLAVADGRHRHDHHRLVQPKPVPPRPVRHLHGHGDQHQRRRRDADRRRRVLRRHDRSRPRHALSGSGASAASTLTISSLSKGAHAVRAVYTPTGDFLGGGGSVSQTVGSLTTTGLVSSDDPSAVGQSVIFTATVTNITNGNTPTGQVEFFDGTTDLGAGSALSGGSNSATSTLTISTLALGNDAIQAVYSGTGVFADSNDVLTQSVDAATNTSVASADNASTFGEVITFTATVTNTSGAGGTPTGKVEFFDGSTDLGPGTALTGPATATSTLAISSRSPSAAIQIRAVYTPSGHFLGGAGSVTQTVDADVGTAVLKADGSLWQFGPTGALQPLSPAGTILSVSAADDAAGYADVFAVTADRHLWEHSAAGWALISTGSFQQISAARNAAGNAVVFAVLTDHSLWEYSSLNVGGWVMLSPTGTILSVSAVTDSAGRDDAFAVTASGDNLWEHSPNAGWVQLSIGSFQQVSAGLNGAGQAVVYGVLGAGAGGYANSLWEYDPTSAGWQMLSGPGTILSVSAGGADEVFAITSDHHLWDYQMGGWSLRSTGDFASISGAEAPASGHSEVFAVLGDSSVWEYDAFLPNGPWEDLIASGAAAVSAPRERRRGYTLRPLNSCRLSTGSRSVNGPSARSRLRQRTYISSLASRSSAWWMMSASGTSDSRGDPHSGRPRCVSTMCSRICTNSGLTSPISRAASRTRSRPSSRWPASRPGIVTDGAVASSPNSRTRPMSCRMAPAAVRSRFSGGFSSV